MSVVPGLPRAGEERLVMAIRDSLALTEDQHALQDTLRGFLAGQLPPAVLRGMLEKDPGYDPELHARMARETGLTGLTIPEKFGGLGLSQARAYAVHTELGRVLYPGPFLASCLAATTLLAAAGHEAAGHWLALLADGSVTGTIAVADKDGRWSSGPSSIRAHLTSPGWRLYGRCWYVIAAHAADIITVPAVAGSVPATFLVEAGAPGLAVSSQPGLDLTRRVCVTAFEATPAVLLGQGEAAAAALARAEREFLLATAAEAVGGISWCLDAAVASAKDAVRSGRPAGSFQAAARVCVDMLEAFQSAEAAVRHAAVADADGAAEAPAAARVAALTAGRAYRTVTEAAVRLFGGIGFTREHDAHLYYRRAWSAERLSGGPQAHRVALDGLLPSPSRSEIGPVGDEAFLGGATSQRRWQDALAGRSVLRVGVRCDGAVAAGREMARGDRIIGMAASQAELVHRGVVYDLEVDTTYTEALDCARAIAARAY